MFGHIERFVKTVAVLLLVAAVLLYGIMWLLVWLARGWSGWNG